MKARLRMLLALGAVLSLLLVSGPALASGNNSHITINSFSNTPDTNGTATKTVTDTTITIRADWMTIDMDGGIQVTHDSASGSPSYGEQVGVADVITEYIHTLCDRRTYSYPITWEDPSAASYTPPSGYSLIAYMEIDAGFITVPAYVIEDNAGEDMIKVDMPGSSVCSGTTSEMDVTTWSHSGTSNSVVAENGSTGSYTLSVTVTDSNGDHTDTIGFSVS